MGRNDIVTHIKAIDQQRARLRRLLRGKDLKVLNRPSPKGEWSIVDNVRHLLWAEQRHLGRFLPGGFEWNRTGLTGFRGKEFAAVGTKPTRDIDETFAEWDAVHRPIRSLMKSSSGADAEKALLGNHTHLVYHIDAIEKLLAKWEA